jgi:hypothetical protein
MSDKGWRQFAEVLQHFCATDAFADHYRVRNIDPMYLGTQISQYRDQSCYPRPWTASLNVVCYNATTLWHFDAAEWAPSQHQTRKRSTQTFGGAQRVATTPLA